MSWISSLQNVGINGIVNALETAVPGKTVGSMEEAEESNDKTNQLQREENLSRHETERTAIEAISMVFRRMEQTTWRISWYENLWGELYVPIELRQDFLEYLQVRSNIEDNRHHSLASLYYALRKEAAAVSSNPPVDAFSSLIATEQDQRFNITLESDNNLKSISSFMTQMLDDRTAFSFGEASARRQILSSENEMLGLLEVSFLVEAETASRRTVSQAALCLEAQQFFMNIKKALIEMARTHSIEINKITEDESTARDALIVDYETATSENVRGFETGASEAIEAVRHRQEANQRQFIEIIETPETDTRDAIQSESAASLSNIKDLSVQSRNIASERHQERVITEAATRDALLENCVAGAEAIREEEITTRGSLLDFNDQGICSATETEQRSEIQRVEELRWSELWSGVVEVTVSVWIVTIQQREAQRREELMSDEDSAFALVASDSLKESNLAKREETMRRDKEATVIRSLSVREQEGRSTITEQQVLSLLLLDGYLYFLSGILKPYEDALKDISSLKRAELNSILDRNQILTQELNLRTTELTGMEKAERDFEAEEEATKWTSLLSAFNKLRDEIVSEIQQREAMLDEAAYSLKEDEAETRGHIAVSEESSYWELMQMEQTEKASIPEVEMGNSYYYNQIESDDDVGVDNNHNNDPVPEWGDDDSDPTKEWYDEDLKAGDCYSDDDLKAASLPSVEVTDEVEAQEQEQEQEPQLIDTVLSRFNKQTLFTTPLHFTIQSDDFLSVTAVVKAIQQNDPRVIHPSASATDDVPILVCGFSPSPFF
eukprot:TRINITY_DN5532_c0_g1_i2.p1 TRINITY_DN5532_c0_g1~~TRINITY_DN5532_c0_g1_i2.p1  ORF type:complete len:785 (+),score=214.47 TRINITY_DN5532_c0_g1_i2:85-2439(+)